MLTFWVVIPFTAFCANLALCVYAVHMGLRNPVNRMFAFLAGCLAWWSLLSSLYAALMDPVSYRLAVSFSAPVWIFIGPLILHFVLVVLRQGSLLSAYPLYLLAYVPGCVLLVLQWFTPLVYTVDPMRHPWGFQVTAGPLLVFHLLYLQLFSIIALVLLARQIFRARTVLHRRRMLYLTVGMAIPLVGGTTTNVLFPLLGIKVYFGAVPLTTIMAVFFAIGIFRYRMLHPTLMQSSGQVLRAMSQPVLLVAPSGAILEANEAAQRLADEASDTLVGAQVDRFLSGGGAAWTGLLAQRDAEEQVASVEMDWHAADETSVPMLVSLTTLRGTRGGLDGYLVLATDYSDVKQAQAALQESEELYRSLYDHSVQGIALLREGAVLEVNRALCTLLGCEPEDVIGHDPREFWPERQPDGRLSTEAILEFQRQALAGIPQSFAWRAQRMDGTLVDCEAALHVVRVRGHRLLQIAVRDVTEQRRLEEAIQYLHDATATVVGEAFFAALAHHLAQWLGMTWAQVAEIHPDDPEQLRLLACWPDAGSAETTVPVAGGAAAAILREGFRYVREGARAVFPDDALLTARGVESYVGLPLRDPDGRTIGLMCAFHDRPLLVPERLVEALFTLSAARASAELLRLRAEAQERAHADSLRDLQRMESISVLAGGVAHDFNNILVGVLGHASLAREVLPPESPAHHSLSVIEDSAERAVGLTSQLLAYARGGKQNPVPVSLRSVVMDLLEMLEAVLPKGVKVHAILPEDVPPVLADVSQLQQLVMNLCTNAGEAMAQSGGTLTVALGVRTGAPHCPAASGAGGGDRHVTLTVADTGTGMDAETRARIFDPFFTTKDFGRGLGLSAALGIAQSHHGCLHCEVSSREGTRFRLTLPAHEAPVAAPAPAPLRTPLQTGSETILLVDDEPLVLNFANDVLDRLGYNVLVASNGDEALRVYEAHGADIDLVVMDMVMPGRNGLQTLEALRAINPGLRAVLTSGYTQEELAQQFQGEQPTGFLKKPYRVPVLAEAVRTALGR